MAELTRSEVYNLGLAAMQLGIASPEELTRAARALDRSGLYNTMCKIRINEIMETYL